MYLYVTPQNILEKYWLCKLHVRELEIIFRTCKILNFLIVLNLYTHYQYYEVLVKLYEQVNKYMISFHWGKEKE